MKNLSLHIVLVLFSCVGFLGCKSDKTIPPTVQKGKIDLSKWNFEGSRIIKLNGDWEFYWNTLAAPNQLTKNNKRLPTSQFVKVPSSWTSYQINDKNLPPHGYATYCLRIKLPERSNMRFGLFIPKIWSATKVWINDSLIYTSGKVAKTYADYQNLIVEKLVEIEPKKQEVHLVVQVANHDIFIGGLFQPFQIGYYNEILESNSLQYSWTMMWLGVLLVMGLYHFILFLFRQKNKSTLYFGILSILLGLRLIVFGNHYIYEYLKAHSDLLSFAIQSKIYYGTTFWLPPVGLLYIRSLFSDNVTIFNRTIPIVSKLAIKISLIVTGLYTTFILIVSPVIFTPTIFFYQPLMGLFAAYLFFGIILAVVFRKEESLFQMLGMLTMALAGIHDGLLAVTNKDLLGLGGLELLPLAFSIFLSLQFLIIARRFSRAFLRVEDLSANLEIKVEERTKELNQKNVEIEQKNEQLQLKNKNITDSIQYAQRIQKAILGSQQHIEEKFKDAFIFLRARDIVSGDFYWYSEAGCNQDWLYNDGISAGNNGGGHLPMIDIKIVVAADCTGHGVPGAFMTIMGNDLLNEIVDDQCIHKPSMILKELDKKVRATLQGQGEEKTDDGMDMTVITIDETHQKLYFSGAKNSILLVRRGDVFRLKGSIYPVGSAHYKADRDYQMHVFETQPDDVIYMFSDGFQDQFGGKNGRKYMSKRFRKFLLSISHLPMKEQRAKLKAEFDNWIGTEHQQTDDVLVMGIRL